MFLFLKAALYHRADYISRFFEMNDFIVNYFENEDLNNIPAAVEWKM